MLIPNQTVFFDTFLQQTLTCGTRFGIDYTRGSDANDNQACSSHLLNISKAPDYIRFGVNHLGECLSTTSDFYTILTYCNHFVPAEQHCNMIISTMLARVCQP
jgi:hypothetical protein